MLQYFSPFALSLGVLVNIFASIAASFLVSFFWVFVWSAQGLNQMDIHSKLSSPFEIWPLALSVLFAGAAVDLLAAYVAALKAVYLEYWHALLTLLVTFLIFSLIQPRSPPEWVIPTSLFLGSLASIWGAYLAKQKKPPR